MGNGPIVGMGAQTVNIVQVDFSLRRWKGPALPGTCQHVHPLCCAFPCPHIPFHCSNWLRCTFIHLREPVRGGSGHTSRLKRSAQACVFTFSHHLARECWELTTLWVARLDDGTELKVTDPKEQQRDVEEEKAEGEKRRDGVDGGRRRAGCCWRGGSFEGLQCGG